MPLKVLRMISYDILNIYEKLVAGWVFELVVCDVESFDSPRASWEGVADVMSKNSVMQQIKLDLPVTSEMRRHMEALHMGGSGVQASREYALLQQQYRPEQPSYTFKTAPAEDCLDDARFAAFVEAGKGSAALVRASTCTTAWSSTACMQGTDGRGSLKTSVASKILADFEGVAQLCARHCPDIENALRQHKAEVLHPLTQQEWEHLEQTAKHHMRQHHAGKAALTERHMTYGHFQASPQMRCTHFSTTHSPCVAGTGRATRGS